MNDTEQKSIRANYHALVREDIFPLMHTIGGTLLDVGGGIGATASALKTNGYVDRAGVVDLIEQKENPLELDFHHSGNLESDVFLENICEKEGKFSVILCLDVLEHLSDPWKVIRHLHSALTPNGIMIASIPNIRHYKASFPLFFLGRWNLEDSGIRDRTHLRWFVKDTAIDLMTSSGLTLEEVIGKPGGGTKTKLFRAITFGIGSSFTNLQYLIRVKNNE